MVIQYRLMRTAVCLATLVPTLLVLSAPVSATHLGGQSGLDGAGGQIAFEVLMAADRDLVQNPDDPLTALLAAWRTQHDLRLARNMPFLLLTNTSDLAAAEINSMAMTIGSEEYNFSSVQVVQTAPGVTVAVRPFDSADDQRGADRFELELAGLVPGKFVLLRLDLDADDIGAYPLPDFRTVLFQANGQDPSNNSTVTVGFDAADGFAPTTLGATLDDYSVVEPFFVGPGFHASAQRDHVRVFPVRRSGAMAVQQAIAEPSALTLLVIGACVTASAAGLRYYRRLPPRKVGRSGRQRDG
ncbi:MAG: hypothetical protein A2W31_00360 [Planctomycetes bacterium RBG_16_64_10]|nr:MAG: hypothetical protein A2W31_00360 [Planctomycetes bacterium RBG_16_64_10]